MNLLLLLAHDIAEYDDLRMFSHLGYDVFSIGGYSNPQNPATDIRPPAPEVPYHPELEALCHAQRVKHEGEELPPQFVDWAKADLHPDLIDWADVIIVHHYLDVWVARQWAKLRHKRVIWRTCGQSDTRLEEVMTPLHRDGLQIVRYSPKEQEAFTRLGVFAGQDALIRFGKDPNEWSGWTGEDAVVGNVTQNMAGRGEWCGVDFWLQATSGLPVKPAGLESEKLPGGTGKLSYDEMRAYLRSIRVYLYTGTQPASYTLGFIEAMMTGVPVIAMGPESWWVPDLYEAHELVDGALKWSNDPTEVNHILSCWYLDDPDDMAIAREDSEYGRRRAIDLFGIEKIGRQWVDFLGAPSLRHDTLLAAAAS